MRGWKLFTHDLRSPLRRGDPVWDGSYPYTLPEVELNRCNAEYGPGWHFCETLVGAIRVVGFCPDGWSSRAIAVEPKGDVVQQSATYRCSSLTLLHEATVDEWRVAIVELSAPLGAHAEVIASEQLAWREALARPLRDEAAVDAGLREALAARGLEWQLHRYQDAMAARIASDGTVAVAAWDAAVKSQAAARAFQLAMAAWNLWNPRNPWNPWNAWAAASDVWFAWAAQAALTIQYAARMGWIACSPDRTTIGIRDAYRHGLAVALPCGPTELGWAMENQ